MARPPVTVPGTITPPVTIPRDPIAAPPRPPRPTIGDTVQPLTETHDICADQEPSPDVVSLPPLRREIASPPTINPDGSIGPAVLRQRLAGRTELMWEIGQTLRVKMMGGTPGVHRKVRTFAELWTQHANIKFAFVDPSEPAEIRISFNPGSNHSKLGRDALLVPLDFPTMNLGLDDSTPDDAVRRHTLHEFGHALGLIHEHQQPAAGIDWNREKVYEYYKRVLNWDKTKVDAQVLDKYTVQHTNFSRYDPSSIMHYTISPTLTLSGWGSIGSTDLSPMDKEYIGNWYPFPPTPNDAEGLLRTGDDCDEIEFKVEYNHPDVPGDAVVFVLTGGRRELWWKRIEVPTGGSGGYDRMEVEKLQSASITIPVSDIDVGRPLRFWKAKFVGERTRLGFTWDVLTAIPPKSRASFVWRRDNCGG